MKRTKLLQELLMLRFEEAYQGWQEKRLTQEDAARLLGVSDRTFRGIKNITKYTLGFKSFEAAEATIAGIELVLSKIESICYSTE